MRNFGACPNGVASRSCCATQESVGDRATATWITFRDAQFDDEERKEWSKEEIGYLQKVASPDLRCVSMHKCCPLLPSWLGSTNIPHVLLDGTLTHMHTQFQEFPANTFCTPV